MTQRTAVPRRYVFEAKLIRQNGCLGFASSMPKKIVLNARARNIKVRNAPSGVPTRRRMAYSPTSTHGIPLQYIRCLRPECINKVYEAPPHNADQKNLRREKRKRPPKRNCGPEQKHFTQTRGQNIHHRLPHAVGATPPCFYRMKKGVNATSHKKKT